LFYYKYINFIGGDSDTIAAITGGIAEAFYGIPVEFKSKAKIFLNSELRSIYNKWNKNLNILHSKKKSLIIQKLINKLDNIKKAFAIFIGKYKNKNSGNEESGSFKVLKPGEVIYCGVVFLITGEFIITVQMM